MKKLIISCSIFSFLLFLLGCQKGNETSITESEVNTGEPCTEPYDCVFEQINENMDGIIDEEEAAIMKICRDYPLNSIQEIENNLIGQWKLIGHGEGWFAQISEPCALIDISDESLSISFQDSWIDTTITTNWEVQEFETTYDPPQKYYKLVTESGWFPLHISHFSKYYMFLDATPLDGNMYLYQKMKE